MNNRKIFVGEVSQNLARRTFMGLEPSSQKMLQKAVPGAGAGTGAGSGEERPGHKYIRREMGKDGWEYIYQDHNGKEYKGSHPTAHATTIRGLNQALNTNVKFESPEIGNKTDYGNWVNKKAPHGTVEHAHELGAGAKEGAEQPAQKPQQFKDSEGKGTHTYHPVLKDKKIMGMRGEHTDEEGNVTHSLHPGKTNSSDAHRDWSPESLKKRIGTSGTEKPAKQGDSEAVKQAKKDASQYASMTPQKLQQLEQFEKEHQQEHGETPESKIRMGAIRQALTAKKKMMTTPKDEPRKGAGDEQTYTFPDSGETVTGEEAKIHHNIDRAFNEHQKVMDTLADEWKEHMKKKDLGADEFQGILDDREKRMAETQKKIADAHLALHEHNMAQKKGEGK